MNDMDEEYGHLPDAFLLNPEEIQELRKQKHEITEYAKEKLRKMTEDAAKKEAANNLYQDALQELDNLAVGDVDSEDFMNAYLIIQTALKVALGEEDV
jgi:molecular chaperone DnaK (HSP70)